ncbi:MAG: TatD family hydrolase [Elusimicrobia bacterium]|nr:TatD family hydrolase [Elusimicrobiota bacterium]
MLIDTHAHLSDTAFDGDRSAVLARALEAGVGVIVDIADSPDDWDRVLALCRSSHSPLLRCALGLHPYYADRDPDPVAEALARKAKPPEAVAFGEIGLDYARCRIAHEVQQRAFLRLLEAADASELPVVIHCRDSFADTLDLLEGFYRGRAKTGRFRGVLHCFSGKEPEAQRGVSLGFALGVDGPVTYPANDALRAALRRAGLAHLVLETDSPYLPPQASRGKRNEPAAVKEIAAGLAAALGETPEEVGRITSENAKELFRL